MGDEVSEFWAAFEKETGERVVAKGMGALKSEEEKGADLWGLLVVTDKAFRFRYLPSENWISSFFSRAGRGAKPKTPVEVVIPFGDMIEVVVPEHGFFAKLFGPAFTPMTIRKREGEGELAYRFSFDDAGKFLQALRATASAAKAAAGAIPSS